MVHFYFLEYAQIAYDKAITAETITKGFHIYGYGQLIRVSYFLFLLLEGLTTQTRLWMFELYKLLEEKGTEMRGKVLGDDTEIGSNAFKGTTKVAVQTSENRSRWVGKGLIMTSRRTWHSS